jgi:hypothetical protein
MLLVLTSCSACRFGIEPMVVRTDVNRLKADGLILSINCK